MQIFDKNIAEILSKIYEPIHQHTYFADERISIYDMNVNSEKKPVNAMQKLPVFCHAKTSGFTTMDLACLCSCIFSTDVPVAGYTCIAYAVALVQLFFVRLFPV